MNATRSSGFGLVGGFALSVSCASAVAAPPCKAERWTAFEERFMSADCTACWARPAPANRQRARGLLAIDWIVPAGGDATMSAAALPEALERLPRAGQGPQSLSARSGWQLKIADGPAWAGYVGVQLTARATGLRAAPGARAFAALVERVPAGADGTGVERLLVRAALGPFPLDAATREPQNYRHAVRVSENVSAERLTSVAWLETPDGRVLAAVAAPRCPATGATTGRRR